MIADPLAAATAAYRAGDFSGARALLETAQAAGAGRAPCRALRGLLAASEGDTDQAVALLADAVATASKPHPDWLAALGSLHRRRFELDRADELGRRAVAIARGVEKCAPLLELARTAIDREDSRLAEDCFLAALRIDPNSTDAHYGLATVLLARGDYLPGWREYEWRPTPNLPRLASSVWNGMDLPRGRLVVISDQGFGDAVMFARFLPMAARKVGELVLACPPELRTLLARIPGVARAVDRIDEIPAHLAHARLSSLPYLLNIFTRAMIPNETPYLTPDPDRCARWAAELAALPAPRGARRIGLVWAGRRTHHNDHRRSLDLARMLALVGSLSDNVCVSLQKDRNEDDRHLLAHAGIHDLADQLTDFGETAAVVASLDMIVSVDTAVAHLAGALGVPVHLLLTTPAEWRWERTGETSPWYPSTRLSRQLSPGDWAGTVLASRRAEVADNNL